MVSLQDSGSRRESGEVTEWRTVPFDAAVARRLAAEVGLPVPLAAVLVGRGYTDGESVRRLLNPRLSEMGDPLQMPGVDTAVRRVLHALATGERIAVYGDYDVDGVASAALLVSILRRLGGDAEPFLPNRLEEGYGMSPAALQRCLKERAPKLIITVDCGTCSREAVELARRCGVDVVVTDHHEPVGPCAPAVAVVNPKLGADAGTHALAGVGVAFKLCHALLKVAGRTDPHVRKVDLREWLDLVAVGTVADVVPLTGENRALVRQGLARLNSAPRVGLKAILEVAGLKSAVNTHHIGFVIGPRLNAVGRLGSAEAALELLMCQDSQRARVWAGELDAANEERRRIEESILTKAFDDIAACFDERSHFGLVTGGQGWHVGTIGIVAARICARYGRPAIVVGFDEDGIGRGSGRSIEGIDLIGALEQCADLLVSFGGHKMAAGLEVKREHFHAFRERFNMACRSMVGGKPLRPVRRVDAWISLRQINADLLEGIQHLEPFGLGNPVPLWGVRHVQIVGTPRAVGRDARHLKMIVADGASQIEAIGFNMAGVQLPSGPLDLLCRIEENTYMGQKVLQLNVHDFIAARNEAEVCS